MTTVKFALKDFPLATSLGGISWLEELRRVQSENDLTVVDGARTGLIEQRAALSGNLESYSLYFLTSRGRVRLAPRDVWDKGYFSKPYSDSAGCTCYDLRLVVDVPRGFKEAEASATLTITPELESSLRPPGFSQTSKIVGIMMPPEADFSNALSFIFVDQDGTQNAISTNITPGLTRFIVINAPYPKEFLPLLAYDIHYIGQTSSQIEQRLNAHEKIRLLADKLLMKQLDQEPVVFAYTFHCDNSLDAGLALDLIEAALISHFKPVLNIDKRNFPEAVSPTEKNLRSRIEAAKIDFIEVEAIGTLPRLSTPSCLLLADGFGFTRDEHGLVRSVSDKGFTIKLT